MAQPGILTIRVPNNLKQRIEITAKEQGVSINQLAMYMFTREISSFEAGNRISTYWHDLDKNKIFDGFDSVMQKVKKSEVPDWDKV